MHAFMFILTFKLLTISQSGMRNNRRSEVVKIGLEHAKAHTPPTADCALRITPLSNVELQS